MTVMGPIVPKVFISYSHDSPEHADRVLNLSNRLLADGVDCILDQYESSPPEGWPRWMDKHIRESEFVLMICTETYCRRVMGTERPGTGLGVRWEGNLIYQHIYNTGTLNPRFIPVLPEGGNTTHIPTPVQGATHYIVHTKDGYEDLYRRITKQPLIVKPNLGMLRQLPPRERKQNFFALPWNVPYERNTYFTGRDKIITDLAEALSKDSAGALTQQAISGLGGIGKTQVAVEYAYRYRDKYKAVFWVRSETTLDLSSGFLEMAKLLDLPEKDARDSNEAVSAVKRWLQDNSGWLLILDNADNPELVKEFRPLNPKGHILLTSRAQVFQILGISKPIEINEMSPKEALEFLYKRTGRKESDSAEKEAAGNLAKELGYLPLALEQAAAYITAKQARFQDYLASYLKRRLELLEKSAPVAGDYEKSVATTWAMNFSEVEKESKAAADLLRISAFLAPDNIPMELIKDGASQMGDLLATAISKAKDDILAINELLEPLTRYSLIRRDIDAHTYSIHRMVQEVLKRGMDLDTQKLWAERVVRAMCEAFPDPDFANWSLCDRLLSQGTVTTILIEEHAFEFPEVWLILNQFGFYLKQRGKLAEAELLLKKSLSVAETKAGPEHQIVGTSLNNLAELYHTLGNYHEAEFLYKRSLSIWEKTQGPEHPNVALSLNNLAELFREEGKYGDAEPLIKRALAIKEKALGPEHPDVAVSLNNLAGLNYCQGKYVEADPLYKRALAIREKALGPEHPDVAVSLNNLALLYHNQGRYAEAEPLYKRALAIREKALGPEHPSVATTLNNLAGLLRIQGKVAGAEPLYQQALTIRDKALGPEHPDVAVSLNNLALFYHSQGRYAEAEPFYQRSLTILEKVLGLEHPNVATNLNNLAGLYCSQGNYGQAEPLYKRSLAILEKALGAEHPNVATSLENYASLLRKINRVAGAIEMEARAKRIRAKQSKKT